MSPVHGSEAESVVTLWLTDAPRDGVVKPYDDGTRNRGLYVPTTAPS